MLGEHVGFIGLADLSLKLEKMPHLAIRPHEAGMRIAQKNDVTMPQRLVRIVPVSGGGEGEGLVSRLHQCLAKLLWTELVLVLAEGAEVRVVVADGDGLGRGTLHQEEC